MKNLKFYQKTIAVVLAAGCVLSLSGCNNKDSETPSIIETESTTFEHQANYLKGYIDQYLKIIFVEYPDHSQGYRLVVNTPGGSYNGDYFINDFITGESQYEEIRTMYTSESLLPYLVENYGDKSTYTYDEIINTFNKIASKEPITEEENTKEYVLTKQQ